MSIQYTVISHLLDAQFAAEEAMLAQCAKGTYTIEKPYVKLNPYGIAPLTALVYFQTASPCSVEICVRGKEAAGDIRWSFVSSTEHYLPILGLYADSENCVEICLSTGERTNLSIKTDPAPEGVHSPTKIETTAEYLAGKLIFLSPTSPGNVAPMIIGATCAGISQPISPLILSACATATSSWVPIACLCLPTIQPGFLNLA